MHSSMRLSTLSAVAGLSACAGSGVEAASDAPGAAVVSPSESVVFAMMVPSVAILDFTDGDDARVGSASSFHRYRIPPAASTIRLILFVPISCIVGHVGPLLRSFCALNNDARHPLERGAGHRNRPQSARADREHPNEISCANWGGAGACESDIPDCRPAGGPRRPWCAAHTCRRAACASSWWSRPSAGPRT